MPTAPEEMTLKVIAHIHTAFPTKFGIPRQSGLVEELRGEVVFTPEYRSADAVRGLEDFSHIWLVWQFSGAVRDSWSPTVRPPRLGGNTRMGVFAKLAQGETSTPLPPMMEMLCVTLLLEIVREAGLRAPQSISHTVSLVGALIIGETAVSAGIVSVPVLTMAAAATIATLAVPSLYEQTILFRFAVILLAGCFGVPGLACAALTILAMACGSEPFGYDYLYPLLPPTHASLRDGFVRSIWSRLAQSGEVLSRDEP